MIASPNKRKTVYYRELEIDVENCLAVLFPHLSDMYRYRSGNLNWWLLELSCWDLEERRHSVHDLVILSLEHWD